MGNYSIRTLAAASQLGDIFVSPKLKIPFIIFCCIEFLILSGGSPSDPTKSFVAAWFDWLKYAFAKNKMYTDKSEVKHNNENVFEAKIEDK